MINIVPKNESKVQRSIENIGTKVLEKFELEKITLDPLKCETILLPHLAFSLDVDITGLEEDETRAYLHNAREIQRRIGSSWAVNKAASSIFGEDIKAVPWFKYGGEPRTYKLDVNVTPVKSVNEVNLNKTIKLIDSVKPVSVHLSAISLNIKESCLIKVAAGLISSETVSVLPQVLENIEVNVNSNFAIGVFFTESIILKPSEV